MTESLVRQARDGDVAIVTLNRPARHNALVPELLTALLAALDDVAAGDAAALVLASEGRSFSTGGDLSGFLEHRESIGAYAERLVGLLNEVILALHRLPFPTVCAVSGQVCGGSLGLLLACDRVVMQQDAGIAPWYRAVGFSPDGGWAAMLPEVIFCGFNAIVQNNTAVGVLDSMGSRGNPPAQVGLPVLKGIFKNLAQAKCIVHPFPGGAGMDCRRMPCFFRHVVVSPLNKPSLDLPCKTGSD